MSPSTGAWSVAMKVGSSRSSSCQRAIPSQNVASTGAILEEDEIELRLLGFAGPADVSLKVEAPVRLARRMPPARDMMAGRIEECAQAQLLFRHLSLTCREAKARFTRTRSKP